MKKEIVGLTLLLFVLACKPNINSDTTGAQANKPDSVQIMKSSDVEDLFISGTFSKPITSPNFEYTAFSDQTGDKIFIKSKADKTPVLLIHKAQIANDFAWSKDGKHILYKEKTKDYKIQIKQINIETKTISDLSGLPKHTILKGLSISDTIYYLDAKTLAVKAKYKDREWGISQEPGNYYNVEISPNNKFIVAHKGASVFLFSSSGVFIKKLGTGIATSWHRNSQALIGFIDTSDDGHSISSSDLFLYPIDADSPIQITNTKDRLELWPSFKSETEVWYRDETNKRMASIDISAFLK